MTSLELGPDAGFFEWQLPFRIRFESAIDQSAATAASLMMQGSTRETARGCERGQVDHRNLDEGFFAAPCPPVQPWQHHNVDARFIPIRLMISPTRSSPRICFLPIAAI